VGKLRLIQTLYVTFTLYHVLYFVRPTVYDATNRSEISFVCLTGQECRLKKLLFQIVCISF